MEFAHANRCPLDSDNLLDTHVERPFFHVKGDEGIQRGIEAACRISSLCKEENE